MICDFIVDDENKYLMARIPPAHGKSIMITHAATLVSYLDSLARVCIVTYNSHLKSSMFSKYANVLIKDSYDFQDGKIIINNWDML